jgi:hypothetical protein
VSWGLFAPDAQQRSSALCRRRHLPASVRQKWQALDPLPLSLSEAVAGSDLFASTPAAAQTRIWAEQAYSSQLVLVWSLKAFPAHFESWGIPTGAIF